MSYFSIHFAFTFSFPVFLYTNPLCFSCSPCKKDRSASVGAMPIPSLISGTDGATRARAGDGPSEPRPRGSRPRTASPSVCSPASSRLPLSGPLCAGPPGKLRRRVTMTFQFGENYVTREDSFLCILLQCILQHSRRSLGTGGGLHPRPAPGRTDSD